MSIGERISKRWNTFTNKDPTDNLLSRSPGYYVSATYSNPGTVRFQHAPDQSMIDAVINKFANDAAAVEIVHCKLDDTERFQKKIEGPLQTCLELEANIDQAATAFRRDFYSSLLDWGAAAIVPIETDDSDVSPEQAETKSIPVVNMRVGKVVEWAPRDVKVSVYNEWTGFRQELWVSKIGTCIVQNPFYDVMNRPNSALIRLKNKLQLSDIVDDQTANNKFNLIIQMPWSVKTEGKRALAEERVRKLEDQLSKSKYGIGYIDSTEHVTQLNRALDNHILESIEYYQKLLYDQLGITPEILNGTASEEQMNNYYTRVIEPIITDTCEEIKRKFLSKTARSQKQSIEFYRDPFKLLPVTQIPEIADKVTRNEIMTSNEVRQAIGMRPSKDPSADELRNKNLSEAKGEEHVDINGRTFSENQHDKINKEENQNGK